MQSISSGFDNAAEISLFIGQDVTDTQSSSLLKRLSLYPEVKAVRFISKQDALTEFKATSGLVRRWLSDDNHCPPSLW